MTDESMKNIQEEAPAYKFAPYDALLEKPLDPIQWKPIKDKIFNVISSTEDQTYSDFLIALEILKIILYRPDQAAALITTPAVKDYFLNDFFPNVAKYLLMNRNYRLKKMQDLHDEILIECLSLYLRYMEEPQYANKHSEMLKTVLDNTRNYYLMNNLNENGERPFGVLMIDQEQHDWRLNLKVGSCVDAVKYEQVHGLAIWSPAMIIEVDPLALYKLKVSFQYEKNTFNRTITRFSHEIQPYGSQTSQNGSFKWRLSLKPNGFVDCSDSTNVWYNSTIIDARQSEELWENDLYFNPERRSDLSEEEILERKVKPIYEVKIGFRIYSQHGNKYDKESRPYVGWSEKFDQWLTSTHPSITKQLLLRT